MPVAFIAQMPQLGVAVWLVNVIDGAFGFWQEYRAERATAALKRLLPHYARVLRDGQEQRVLAEELVPGDVLLLAEGDHISADGRLVYEAELRLDQSTLTGEAHPARKTSEAVLRSDLARAELPNLIFAGTSVVAGTGTAVVIATGMDNEFGKIAHITQTVGDEPSPLQQELGNVTRVVTAIAVGIGLIFFALAVALAGINLAESFIFALGMIVAFVPEGLLPTVTLALALGVQRMARRHALVKRLSAVETLGCASVICTDKTGTLTENEMTACAVWLPDRQLTVTGVGYAPEGRILDASRTVPTPVAGDLRQLLAAAGLCTDARLLAPDAESARWTVLGDPTEAALQVVAAKGGLDLVAEASLAPRLHELPFESRRKRMSTIHRVGAARVAYVKAEIGAAHVRRAIEEKIYRASLVQEHVQELISQGSLLIDTSGQSVGQINGLSVVSLGDHTFGRPSRITASVGPGRGDIVDIEREVALGGPIHSKGVLILSGYLTQTYAHDQPLTLSARLVFEQSYTGVEGDSASSAELYALLSTLSGLPIKQSIAVTGAVNQHGAIEAIGGINEKIEGFFDVCRMSGLTGDQGVLIPRSNVQHLMLREDVVAAVRSGQFHIWAVATIAEGIELLTGVPAGQRHFDGQFAEGSLNARVDRRLRAFASAMRGLPATNGAQPLLAHDGV